MSRPKKLDKVRVMTVEGHPVGVIIRVQYLGYDETTYLVRLQDGTVLKDVTWEEMEEIEHET